jgi:hypothetical protein
MYSIFLQVSVLQIAQFSVIVSLVRMSHDSRKCGLELSICERKNANTPTTTKALICTQD